ncbi:hypothetical protein GGI12_004668 [Dipsacomyces acuminosporus]|nr:hypothetical protein GGI12_004668 [Dipsacomyces acuminosporus]
MHVNDLNCDILHRIFAICSLSYNKTSGSYKDYLNLRPVSSVCRYWRPIALPHLYERVFVFHRHGEIHTNAMAIFAGNHFSYVRKLEINVMDSTIDEVEITSVLNRAGIGRAAWPQIKKLEIANTVSKDQLVEAATGFTCSHESVVGYFAKHLPGLSEVKFSQDIWDEYRFVSRSEFPCRLVNGLADTYSTQLHKLHLGIYIDCMSQGLCFPQQLTHMDISMDGYEMGILPSIFAPCLRYLKIRDASSDITWGWFDSGSGADVWFASLTELVVEFDPRPELYRQTYRTGVLFAVELAEYYSDYCEVAKRPHFPALERLTVTSYPYDDHGFYKLFEGCPLKHADI